MRLSLAIGFLMLALKMGAYMLTGSAAILGDAAESVVHVAAVLFASYSFWLAQQPADENHPYGHSKIAFFSAGVEGGLIIIAAVFISYESVRRWVAHLSVANLDLGVLLTLLTVLINAALGFYLVRVGRRQSSLILVANGRHVLTDSWTSLGALIGLGLVYFTGQPWWDPICGLLMAGNILISGYGLLRKSVTGLMDEADPAFVRSVHEALNRETGARGVTFHALRIRDAGELHYIDVHFLFSDEILLRDAHRIATEIEAAVERNAGAPILITTHLECRGDHDELHPGDQKQ